MAHVGSLLLMLELNDKFHLINDIVQAVSFAESIMGYFEQNVFKYVSVELKDLQTALSINKNAFKSLSGNRLFW